ncbi:MAG: UDP-glucose 4-epimerase GalE [Variovorax sp.]
MILVTGGAGYIGSHTCIELARAGHEIAILDNLCNSSADVVDRLRRIVGRDVRFLHGDVRDVEMLERIFAKYPVTAVMHFAGLKAVGESVIEPLSYYDNNVSGTVQLLGAMRRAGCRTFVFSSSATVYGAAAEMPVAEDVPCVAVNPYGRTKLMVEEMLIDLHGSDPTWRIARLRYFNPVGAHESGLIGESPQGTPGNLLPYVAQVAGGLRPRLTVFGGDYPTPDGTGVRDYIHVMDLAEGHVAALEFLGKSGGNITVNLGTGKGTSVLEMISAFEAASGRAIAYEISTRRSGDVAICYADPSRAALLLGWRSRRGIDRMCQDAWRWQLAGMH